MTRNEILSKIDSVNDIELFIELLKKIEYTQDSMFKNVDKKRITIVHNLIDGIIIDLKIEIMRREGK